jgi:hypothetical protein
MTWTPERRAAQAERMRKQNASPDFRKVRVEALNTSLKAHAARKANIAKLLTCPKARAASLAWLNSDEGRAASLRGSQVAAERLAADPVMRLKRAIQMSEVNRTHEKKALVGQQMKKQWRDPLFAGQRMLFAALMARKPEIHAKGQATRRAGKVPEGYQKRYRQLRDRIGAEAAMNIVKREADLAARSP